MHKVLRVTQGVPIPNLARVYLPAVRYQHHRRWISSHELLKRRKFPGTMNTVINVLPQGSVYVVERFGKFHAVKEPGLRILLPWIDKIRYVVDQRELSFRVDPEHAMTQDNVQVRLGGNLYVQFDDAYKAAYGASEPVYSVVQFAQSAMRTCIGGLKLDKALQERNTINERVTEAINKGAANWGCKVLRFEITDLFPTDKAVEDSLHKQSTAEREARERIITAEAKKRQTELETDAYKYQQETKAKGEATNIQLLAKAEADRILMLAEAQKKALEMTAEAIQSEGGLDAVKMKLGSQYIDSLGQILKNNNTIVVPQTFSDIPSVLSVASRIWPAASSVPRTDKNSG